jgi:hypothetical protein
MARTTARGYGWSHQLRRKRLEPFVAAGHATCWRCGHQILPAEPWDLGHDDEDRTRYRGPEHRSCNRGAKGWRVNLDDYRDDPANGVFWGPPELLSGRPRRWSRAWSDWRGEPRYGGLGSPY